VNRWLTWKRHFLETKMVRTRAEVKKDFDEYVQFAEWKKEKEKLEAEKAKLLKIQDELHPDPDEVERTRAPCGHKCSEIRCYTTKDGRLAWWSKERFDRPTYCRKIKKN